MTNGKSKRQQTVGEEIANSISHGVGAVMAIAMTPILIVDAVNNKDVFAVVSAAIFGATMINLYLSSTLYHALARTRAMRVFQVMDHVAIYLLIAGTYTPFTLGVLRGTLGWTLLGVIWGLAILGILLKVFGRLWKGHWSTILYVLMGWMVVFTIKPVWELTPAWGLIWITAGGVFYTLGVLFFVFEKLRYSHFVWHLFVVAGSACHIIAVLYYSG